MMKTCIAAILIILSFKVSAQEVLSEESMKLCQDISIQGICASTCAPACSSTDFLDNNYDFCNSTGVLEGESSALPDDPSCAAKFTSSPDEVVPATGATNSAECDPSLGQIEFMLCEMQNKSELKCAKNIPDLENQIRSVVSRIRKERDRYKDLLSGDWTTIKDQASLCALSAADLDERYAMATNPLKELVNLQMEASVKIECYNNWDQYANAPSSTGKALTESLWSPVARQYSELTKELGSVKSDEMKIKEKEEPLKAIIIQYINHCDPNSVITE